MLLETFTTRFKAFANSIVRRKFTKPYWIKIITKQPSCIYFFGPFDNYEEAKKMQYGYIEDLVAENAVGINVEIKRCLPTKLTISEEEF